MPRSIFSLFVLLLLAGVVALPASGASAAGAALQSGKATVQGRVLSTDGDALPGASVHVVEASSDNRADAYGNYRISGLSAGSYTLVVSYLGYASATTRLELEPRAIAELDVTLEREVYSETVTVRGEPMLEGQAKALNQQKSAINIKNIVAADQIGSFPDPNSAEATQRIPGVSVQRDQGEGRYVQVRGTEPRLSSAMINGETVPSPEDNVRYVALDVIPADLLEAIEVSKALTPDMDGDAIGGAVNLLTKRAPANQRISVDLGTGYNDQSDDGSYLGRFTYGSRFGSSESLGLLVSASTFDTDRGVDGYEVTWDDGEAERLDLLDYQVNRQRTGFTADFDYSLSPRSDFYVRGIYNEYDDLEFRRRRRDRLDNNRIQREFKDRFEGQEIASLSVGGSHVVGSSLLLDYRVVYSEAEEIEPGRLDTQFRQKNVQFAPDLSDPYNLRMNALNEDPTKSLFDEITREDNLATDEDLVASFNASIPFFTDGGTSGFWKLGTKYRAKEKTSDVNLTAYSADDDISIVQFLDGFDTSPFLSGRYNLGSFHRRETSSLLLEQFDLEAEHDFEEDLADYEASEDTLAVYGMAEVDLGKRFKVLGGLRYEGTDVDYNAFELVLDEDGDFVELVPTNGRNDYSELLPMAHLVIGLDDRSNLRAAVTRSLARPNFNDLAPFQLTNREDLELERGNPDLDVTTSWNADLLYERYFGGVGVFSAGLFYKSLDNNIFLFRSEELRGGEVFEVTQPLNGDSAEVTGAEVAFNRRFRKLPGFLSGLGLYFNYTWTDSEADYPVRGTDRLAGQAEEVGNFALSYERGGFSGRLSANWHGEYILEVGSRAASDLWVDEHFQIDFSASQRVTDHLRVFVELVNLDDEPLLIYEGTPDVPDTWEFYSWWGTIGLKLNW